MTIYYNNKGNDTLFFPALTPDIVWKNKIYRDSTFVNTFLEVIKLRDSIFPRTRIILTKDGHFIGK